MRKINMLRRLRVADRRVTLQKPAKNNTGVGSERKGALRRAGPLL